MANLNDLLDHINFKPEDLKEIENTLTGVTDTIDSKAEEGLIPKSFGYKKYGSIDRRTKIKPLDDVDVIYITGTATQNPLGGHLLKECKYTFSEEEHEPSNNISSKKLLNNIKSAIKETYSRSDVRKNNEVVNVWLESYEVGFDIVPAFYVDVENSYYLIPEGGDSHYWKKTDPFKSKQVFEVINNTHNGLLRNVIKIIKYWFQRKKVVSPKSYHLECVLCWYFYSLKDPVKYLSSALYLAFNNLNYESYLLNGCPSLANVNKNISDTITGVLNSEDIKKIEEQAEYAYSILYNEGESGFVKYLAPEIE